MYNLFHSLVCMKIKKKEKSRPLLHSQTFCQKDSSLFPWLATVVWQTHSDLSNPNSDITDRDIFPPTSQVGLDVPIIWIYDTSYVIDYITV